MRSQSTFSAAKEKYSKDEKTKEQKIQQLNPDFAVENLLRLSTAAQLSISEHFLTSK